MPTDVCTVCTIHAHWLDRNRVRSALFADGTLPVGPQLLAVALGSVGLGIATLTVAYGFRRDAKWAIWTAVTLCAIVISVAALAVQAAKAAEWDSISLGECRNILRPSDRRNLHPTTGP